MYKVVLLIAVLFTAAGINSLISETTVKPTAGGKSATSTELDPLIASRNYYQDIAGKLADFDQPQLENSSVVVQKPWEMQVNEQANQQGILDKLYSGEYKYRLMATFNQDEDFALLLKTHQLTDETSLVKLKSSQNLDQYQVEQIEHNHLTLNAAGRKVTLTVFNVKKV